MAEERRTLPRRVELTARPTLGPGDKLTVTLDLDMFPSAEEYEAIAVTAVEWSAYFQVVARSAEVVRDG